MDNIAESNPIKVILIGDDKQLLPVRGRVGFPFRWLREHKKLPVLELCFPYRQKNPVLRQVVLDLYGGQIDAAVEKLSDRFRRT